MCRVAGQGKACSAEIFGYQAKLLDANDTRHARNIWARSGNTSGVQTPAVAPSGQPNTSTGYKLLLYITHAKRRFEAFGSSITYRTTNGKQVTMRAFKPQMVYTPADKSSYSCSNVTVAGEDYIYYEITVGEVAPLLECEVLHRPDIDFSYVYESSPNKDEAPKIVGICTCMLPLKTINKNVQSFRVRAKTRGVRGFSVSKKPDQGKPWFWRELVTYHGDLSQPFRESMQVKGQNVTLSPPGDEFIRFEDHGYDLEPDGWHLIHVNTSEWS
ncbi:hypothetical protein RRG08_058576 [Elysia crispata]|uniref:Uncharacterized protein n=1 Tax=Elysia crispata TaxID=231223 RepID=A0AAE1CKH0_9GAST|nr:hypothetical protein RRG08_058576 [Elysia crispata]